LMPKVDVFDYGVVLLPLLMKSYLNYVWIFIWSMNFQMLELCMNFYLKHEFFVNVF
jgi:hypothetical protein